MPSTEIIQFLTARRLRAIAKFGHGRSCGGSPRLTVSLLGNDLNPIVECHTEEECWQLVVTIESLLIVLRGFDEFEDHRVRYLLDSPSIGSCGDARLVPSTGLVVRGCFQRGREVAERQ
jgi:hypothetical protein